MVKLGPVEKIYEAWTAIVDNRVKEIDPNTYVVKSSDGKKEYVVKCNNLTYSSNDNATYWRGYPGYPVMAVMMIQGYLPLNEEEAEKFRDINWKLINTRYKNNYRAAFEEICKEKKIDIEKAESAANDVMDVLRKLPIEIKRKI